MDLQKFKAIEEQFFGDLIVLLMKYTEELLRVFIAEIGKLLPMPNLRRGNNSNGRRSVNDVHKIKNTWKKRSEIGKRVRILMGLYKGRIGNIVDQQDTFVSVRMDCGKTVNYLPKYLHID